MTVGWTTVLRYSAGERRGCAPKSGGVGSQSRHSAHEVLAGRCWPAPSDQGKMRSRAATNAFFGKAPSLGLDTLRPSYRLQASSYCWPAAVLSYIRSAGHLGGPDWGDRRRSSLWRGLGTYVRRWFGQLLGSRSAAEVLLAWRRAMPAAFAARRAFSTVAPIAASSRSPGHFTWPGALSEPRAWPFTPSWRASRRRYRPGAGRLNRPSRWRRWRSSRAHDPVRYVDKTRSRSYRGGAAEESNFFDSATPSRPKKAREWEGRIRELGPDSPLALAWLLNTSTPVRADPRAPTGSRSRWRPRGEKPASPTMRQLTR